MSKDDLINNAQSCNKIAIKATLLPTRFFFYCYEFKRREIHVRVSLEGKLRKSSQALIEFSVGAIKKLFSLQGPSEWRVTLEKQYRLRCLSLSSRSQWQALQKCHVICKSFRSRCVPTVKSIRRHRIDLRPIFSQ